MLQQMWRNLQGQHHLRLVLQQVPPLEVVEFNVSSAWEEAMSSKDCPNNWVMIVTEDGWYDSASEVECELLAENDEIDDTYEVEDVDYKTYPLRLVTPV